MPKVICSLVNASNLIDGVKFEDHENGKISEEISEALAARFSSIPGYELIVDGDDNAKKAEALTENKKAEVSEKKAAEKAVNAAAPTKNKAAAKSAQATAATAVVISDAADEGINGEEKTASDDVDSDKTNEEVF